MSKSSTAGRASVSTPSSPESMSNSNGSGPAPATRPCQMPRASLSAFSLPPSSIHPHSPLPYSQTKSRGQVAGAVGAVGLAAPTARPRDHATPSHIPIIPDPATTLEQRSGLRHPHQPRGRACIVCLSHRLSILVATHALVPPMLPVSPLSPRPPPCQTTRGHPSFQRKMTKTSP